jgi:hypothetical protein
MHKCVEVLRSIQLSQSGNEIALPLGGNEIALPLGAMK